LFTIPLSEGYFFSYGQYLSPKGTSFPERALPSTTDPNKYHEYRIISDIEAESGTIAPWFGNPGGGKQYKLSDRIAKLSAYFEEVKQK
jgi:hypothetical protein